MESEKGTVTRDTPQEEIIICVIELDLIEVAVNIDLKDGYMMQVMALIDTGSNISFMGQELAPHLPCPGIPIPDVQHHRKDDGA